jgi:hypothetical protein
MIYYLSTKKYLKINPQNPESGPLHKEVKEGGLIRARIFKLSRSPRIDSKESIQPAYVGWWTGTKTLFLLGSWPP